MLFSGSNKLVLFSFIMASLAIPSPIKGDVGDVATLTVLASGGWGAYKLAMKAYDLYTKYSEKDEPTKTETAERKPEAQNSVILTHNRNTSWREIKHNYYRYLESRPWGAVAKRYIEELRTEETAILKEFFELANITKQEFKQYKKDMKAELLDYESRDNAKKPLIDVKHLAHIKSLLYPAGLNAPKLEVRRCKSEFDAEAGINTMWLNLKRKESEHFTVFHEMMHIIHQDHYISCVIDSLQSRCKKYDYLRLKLNHFRERRADILAMLSNPEFAQKILEDFSHSNRPATHFHPSDREICEYSRKVRNEMMYV